MESQTKQPKNNPTPDKILVLGIGNLVLNDEGIGIHVVNALNEMEIPQGVDVLDGGTGGLALCGNIAKLPATYSRRRSTRQQSGRDDSAIIAQILQRLSALAKRTRNRIERNDRRHAITRTSTPYRTTCHQCAQLSSLRHATIARSKKSHTTGIATYF